jgi:hypothetical protein
MQGEKPVPLIVTCDVEPDLRHTTGNDSDWPGFVLYYDYIQSIRHRLEDLTGASVHFNWLIRLDYQIAEDFGSTHWILERHAGKFEKLRAQGDELGLHVHTWRRARRFFRQVWVADYENADWCRACIEMAHEAYSRHFGESPSSISMGDSFMSAEAMKTIEELGIRADSSLLPATAPRKAVARGEPTIGSLPDTRKTPRHPFRPSRGDFAVPGDDCFSIWEIPISTGTVQKNRDGTDRVRKLLLGTNLDHVRGILKENLDAGAPVLVADSRADVLIHPKTAARFKAFFDNFHSIAGGRMLELTTRRAICDRLDNGWMRGVV